MASSARTDRPPTRLIAAAGILEGRPATTHWAAQSSLERFGATPMREARLGRSEKIWTAAGVSAGLDLAFALFGEIAVREAAEVTQLLMEYDPQPPFHAGHPSKASDAVRETAKAEMKRLARNPRDYVSIPKILWRRTIDRSRKLKPSGAQDKS